MCLNNSAGLVKISYEIVNLPWQGPEGYTTGSNSDASWLEVWFNTSCTFDWIHLGFEKLDLKLVFSMLYLLFNTQKTDHQTTLNVSTLLPFFLQFLLDLETFLLNLERQLGI